MSDVPHFTFPFRFEGGAAATNDQDTPEDVAACVAVALRTRPGQHPGAPGFGTPDLTFRQRPLVAEEVVTAVRASEPRVQLLAEEHADALAETVARVELKPKE